MDISYLPIDIENGESWWTQRSQSICRNYLIMLEYNGYFISLHFSADILEKVLDIVQEINTFSRNKRHKRSKFRKEITFSATASGSWDEIFTNFNIGTYLKYRTSLSIFFFFFSFSCILTKYLIKYWKCLSLFLDHHIELPQFWFFLIFFHLLFLSRTSIITCHISSTI